MVMGMLAADQLLCLELLLLCLRLKCVPYLRRTDAKLGCSGILNFVNFILRLNWVRLSSLV